MRQTRISYILSAVYQIMKNQIYKLFTISLLISMLTYIAWNQMASDHEVDNSGRIFVHRSHEMRIKTLRQNVTPQIQLTFKHINATLQSENINCDKILVDNDKREMQLAKRLSNKHQNPVDWKPDKAFSILSCQDIHQNLIITEPTLSDYPIAYSMTIFKDFYQFDKLFRAVYRSHHTFCIHVDKSSNSTFYKAASRLAECLPNVQMAEKRLTMEWGRWNILEAELLCFKQLYKSKRKWKYLINLTGQEYPLRTNNELENILKHLNGTNHVEKSNPHFEQHNIPELENLLFYKGSLHVVLTRKYVNFLFENPLVDKIVEHLKSEEHKRYFPDESLFSTLNNNPDILKVPGAYTGNWTTDNVNYPFFNRYKNWIFPGPFGFPCLSRNIVRQICIWGIEDLPAMNKRFEFFVNKFYYNFEKSALQCMEYRLWKNTLAEYSDQVAKTHTIPISFYTAFDFMYKHL